MRLFLLSKDPRTAPCPGMVVVQTSMGDVYSRLWCVYEISEAVSSQARTRADAPRRLLESGGWREVEQPLFRPSHMYHRPGSEREAVSQSLLGWRVRVHKRPKDEKRTSVLGGGRKSDPPTPCKWDSSPCVTQYFTQSSLEELFCPSGAQS